MTSVGCCHSAFSCAASPHRSRLRNCPRRRGSAMAGLPAIEQHGRFHHFAQGAVLSRSGMAVRNGDHDRSNSFVAQAYISSALGRVPASTLNARGRRATTPAIGLTCRPVHPVEVGKSIFVGSVVPDQPQSAQRYKHHLGIARPSAAVRLTLLTAGVTRTLHNVRSDLRKPHTHYRRTAHAGVSAGRSA